MNTLVNIDASTLNLSIYVDLQIGESLQFNFYLVSIQFE